MIRSEYYELLLRPLPEDLYVRQLVHGVSWTAAVLSDESVGVAMHTAGDSVPRMFDSLVGRPLSEAGRAVLSWNMEEASRTAARVSTALTALMRP